MTSRARASSSPYRRLLLPLLLLLLAACATQSFPSGEEPGQPALALDAAGQGTLATADGLSLPIRAWLPEGKPKAVILAVHGFNMHSGLFDAPAQQWAARGLAVYAYDQRGFGAAPGFGLWGGTEAMVRDLSVAAALLRERYPLTPLYLLGDSMGGAVVMAAQAEPVPPEADGLILVAPAVWAREDIPWYQRAALWLALRIVPGWKPTGEGLEIQASDNIEMLRALGRDPLVIKATRIDTLAGLTRLMDRAAAAVPEVRKPVLLLYGKHDQIIPETPIRRTWADLPQQIPRRLAFYEEGWHMLLFDLEGPRVREDVAAWIMDRRQPLPSGADEGPASVFLAER